MPLDPEMTVKNTVTILTDGTDSTVLVKKHYKYIAIYLPANWVAGTITFKGCDTKDGTFVPILKGSDGTAVVTASVAASNCVVLDGTILEALKSVPFIMLVAGTPQATNDKIITIVLSR